MKKGAPQQYNGWQNSKRWIADAAAPAPPVAVGGLVVEDDAVLVAMIGLFRRPFPFILGSEWGQLCPPMVALADTTTMTKKTEVKGEQQNEIKVFWVMLV